MLPITPDDEVILVRQFRRPIRRMLTEIPAGVLDRPGEDALACASRKLFEETGYRHETIGSLGGIYPPELLRKPFDEMVLAVRAGRVRDATTALALLLADARRASA